MDASKGPIGLALCGFGRAGHIHFKNAISNFKCKLMYIVDIQSVVDSIRQFLAESNIDNVAVVPVEEFESVVLADKAVRAVMIATPTDEHEGYIRRSIRAGKGVFCEKPIAVHVKDIIDCYTEAEKAGVPLLCAFNRRFDDAFNEIRKKIKNGHLGRMHSMTTTSRDHPLPSISFLKVSTGMFHDCAVHDLDVILWMVGEEPSLVFAQGTVHNEEIAQINDVDTIAIVLKFPSGIIATTHLSRHSSYGYDQRLEVLGDNGMLSVINNQSLPIMAADRNGVHYSTYVHSFPQRYEQAYRSELDHFLECVRDPSMKVHVTLNDVLLVTRVIQACEKSFRSNKGETLDPLPPQ